MNSQDAQAQPEKSHEYVDSVRFLARQIYMILQPVRGACGAERDGPE
jgi:hypothetical protein